jgi:hypothetical protein
MDNLVTIMTSTYPHELVILQGRLEAEGIYCFIRDELTAQLNPFVSDAIGGAKLQVREEDAERAIRILEEGGYVEEDDYKPSPLELKLYRILSKIPFLRKIYK